MAFAQMGCAARTGTCVRVGVESALPGLARLYSAYGRPLVVFADNSVVMCTCCSRARSGGDTQSHTLGGDTQSHTLGGDTQSHTLGGDAQSHTLGGDTQSHTLGGDTQSPEAHVLGGNTEAHKLGGDTESHSVSGDTQSHDVSGNAEAHQLGGDTETHNSGGEAETLTCKERSSCDGYEITGHKSFRVYDGQRLTDSTDRCVPVGGDEK